MKEWAFTKYSKSEDTASLRVELALLFWKKCLSDQKFLRVNIFRSSSTYYCKHN